MASNKKNLRYCQVLYSGTYYDIMVAVSDLDEIDQILQDWAINKFSAELDLPAALVMNKDASEVLTSIDADNYVYIDSPVSAYMEMPRYAGVSGTFPTLPTVLNGSGYYVVPACLAYLYSEADQAGYFGEYIIEQSQNFTLTAGMNFIGITFNAGTPIYQIYTSFSSFDFSSIIPIASVLYFGGVIYNTPFGQTGYGLSEKTIEIMGRRKRFDILDPYTLAMSGLYAELGLLTTGYGVNEYTLQAMDTETSGHDLYLYYLNSGLAWTSSKISTLSNSQYQSPLTGIQTLAGGKYVINYLFRAVDPTLRLMFYVLSNTFDTLQAAIDSPEITDIPDAIKYSSVCVGRVIILQGASTGTVQIVQKIAFS